jgi:hypothetical protein
MPSKPPPFKKNIKEQQQASHKTIEARFWLFCGTENQGRA